MSKTLKKSMKGKRVMIDKEDLEELKSNQLDKCSNEDIAEEFKDRIMKPFDNIIEELEGKKEEIEDLKSEIEDLAN